MYLYVCRYVSRISYLSSYLSFICIYHLSTLCQLSIYLIYHLFIIYQSSVYIYQSSIIYLLSIYYLLSIIHPSTHISRMHIWRCWWLRSAASPVGHDCDRDDTSSGDNMNRLCLTPFTKLRIGWYDVPTPPLPQTMVLNRDHCPYWAHAGAQAQSGEEPAVTITWYLRELMMASLKSTNRAHISWPQEDGMAESLLPLRGS